MEVNADVCLGRPGPVLIDIPKDVQQSMAVPDWLSSMKISGTLTAIFLLLYLGSRLYESFATTSNFQPSQKDRQSHQEFQETS